MDDEQYDENSVEAFIVKSMWAGIRNAYIFLIILAVVWSALSIIIPDGWWHIFINIPIFLIGVLFSISIRQTGRAMLMPTWLGWGLSLLGFAILLIVRSIILSFF